MTASREDGFTVVELLVAAVVLLVGIGGIYALVSSSQRANLRAQRQAQAADVGQLELQKARGLGYAALGYADASKVPVASAATGNDATDTSRNPANPNWWVRGSGSAATLLIRTSYRDSDDTTRPAGTPAGGEPFVIGGGTVAAGPDTVPVGTTSATVYRYVTWRDEACAAGCSGAAAETKRVTIAVVLAPQRGESRPKPYWVSTIVSDRPGGA